MPDYFLIAGAQRSGTTLLYELLDQHPKIEMARPLRPEPKFFLRDGECRLDQYEQLFGHKPAARVRGEKSTSYMERGEVASKAAAFLPGLKAVFVLRDPVERALSNYRFSVDNGVETESLEYALRHERERAGDYDPTVFSVSPHAYLARGQYARLLMPWEAALGRSRLYLLSFEELVERPLVVQRLFSWLKVSAEFEPRVPSAPVNASTVQDGIDPAIARKFAPLFSESNELLSRHYGFDTGRWRPAA
jgi:hypothetical protein